MHRLGGFITNRPIAVPPLKPLSRGIALQVEDRHHKQLLLRAHRTEHRPFLQVTLQARRDTTQDHVGQSKSIEIGAIDGHQTDIRRHLGRFRSTPGAESHPRPLQINTAIEKRHHTISDRFKTSVLITSNEIHG